VTQEKETLVAKKTVAILVSGKAGVGKTTLSNYLKDYLVNRYKGVKVGIFPFATRLKQIARLLSWDGVKDSKGRSLLQKLGQLARAYNEDIWVKSTIEGLVESSPNYPYHVIIVDDWRFPNEAKFISNCPLYLLVRVRIEAPSREILKGTPEYDEESETSLPTGEPGKHDYDAVIFNLSSLEDLELASKKLWDAILTIEENNFTWN
jgi:hypothetical protein